MPFIDGPSSSYEALTGGRHVESLGRAGDDVFLKFLGVAVFSALSAPLLLPASVYAAAAAELSGCYEVSVGVYDDGHPLPAPAPPEHIELALEPARKMGKDEKDSRYLIRPRRSSQIDPYRWASWFVEGDVLHLIWSGGFAGVRAKLSLVEGAWKGEVRGFYDTGRTTKPVENSLTLEECAESDMVP